NSHWRRTNSPRGSPRSSSQSARISRGASSSGFSLMSWRNASTSGRGGDMILSRSEEHTSELQSLTNLVCRLLLEKKNIIHALAPLQHEYDSNLRWRERLLKKYQRRCVASRSKPDTPVDEKIASIHTYRDYHTPPK